MRLLRIRNGGKAGWKCKIRTCGQRGHVHGMLWEMMIAALKGFGTVGGQWMKLTLGTTMAVGAAER